MKTSVNDFLPLAPAVLHILAALAGENLHGYGIMQEVARQSDGRCSLGPGTLYDNLQRLVRQGLVEEAPGLSEEQGSRRRYYQLTAIGRGVLSAEISRLEGVVKLAKFYLKGPQPGRA